MAGRIVQLALAALVAALLGACVLAPKLAAPKLSIAGVQVVSGELWVQHLKVRMHVHNPNDRELPVQGRGDAEFDTNVTTNFAGAVLKLLARGPGALTEEVPYRLSGKVSLASGLWRSIPFDEHGTFKP